MGTKRCAAGIHSQLTPATLLQGLYAGLNAALAVKGEAPFKLSRSDAYIGVLVDDLLQGVVQPTEGVAEPYRMFTSRAEHRILLRTHNADQRLTGLAQRTGCVSEERVATLDSKVATRSSSCEAHNPWLRILAYPLLILGMAADAGRPSETLVWEGAEVVSWEAAADRQDALIA